jgi:RNA polymerase sigma-70 factor (ECF subfamily)
MNRTPASLLERLRQPGDDAAWSQFVHLYTPLLFSWAKDNGLSETDAADLVQEVFLILVRALPTFEYQPGGSFRGWLRTIMINRWRTWQRRRQPHSIGADQLDAFPDSAEPKLPGEAEERRQLVVRALLVLERELEPVTWQAFRRYVMLDRRPAEVAVELGVSVNVVYLARSRVLQRLRGMLAGLVEDV